MSARDPAAEVAELRAALAVERARRNAYAELSHELRTLLSGVVGITGLLLDTELSAEQRDYGKRIRTLSDALIGLVNDVLDQTRIEAGKFELEEADLDLRRLVDDVGEMLAERAHDKGIELVAAVADDVPAALRGDPGRLRQVLVNLVSNAIKFTDRGEVVLRAALLETRTSEITVRVEVRDTGIGISPEGQTRLFRPFSQVHEDGGRGGSGLGLALAKEIVEAMGGVIGVESAPGAGSRFHFSARLGRRVTALERGAIPRVDLGGRRALVAAANASFREVLGGMIRALDVELGEAADGARAIEALRGAARALAPYDVVLLDVSLPGAAELSRAIDSEEALGGLPVVLMAYPGERLPEDEGQTPRPPAARALSDPTTLPAHGVATSGRSTPRGALRVVMQLAKPVRRAQLRACLRTLMGSTVETVAAEPRARDAAPESRRGGAASRPRPSTPGAPLLAVSPLASEPVLDGAASGPRPWTPAAPSPPASGRSRAPTEPASRRPAEVGDTARLGLRFPESSRAAFRAAETAPPPSPPSPAPADERPLILLVEDNLVNQRVSKLMMEKRGYRVDVASDGLEAVTATARTVYAAVLMDCQMPRLDGYAATRAIRAREAGGARVPIIAMTANAGPGARDGCLAVGMDDYIEKPVTAEAIDERLRRWLKRPGRITDPTPMPRRPSQPTIDLGMLRKLRSTQQAGEPDIVAEVVALFLRDAPARVDALHEAIAAGDMTTASRVAHTLKGSAGHLGAKTLSALCARFEEKVRANNPFNVAFHVSAIEDELGRVRAALPSEVGEG